MDGKYPTPQMARIARDMESFEAAPSIANTGTGSRREGDQFERLAQTLWHALGDFCTSRGASCQTIEGPRSRVWGRFSFADRSLFLPTMRALGPARQEVPRGWLDLDFRVTDLIAAFPGEREAIARYAPGTGPYADKNYPSMFQGMKTKFDDTILLEDNGVLCEKVLLEYKTAKSSAGTHIDGNAHERLSFQIMQYIEIATRYPKCTLAVLANGALARYRNKYHVNFHVQADRLTCFRWFSMDHFCTQEDYARLVQRLVAWLFPSPPL